MNTPSHPYTKVLDKSLNKIGRAVAGSNVTSIARAVYSHRDIREELLKRLMNDIDNECSTICKYTLPDTGTPSLFRKIDIKDMSIKYTYMYVHMDTYHQVVGTIVTQTKSYMYIRRTFRQMPCLIS